MTQIATINLAGLLSYKLGMDSINRIMTHISYGYSEKKQSRSNDNSHPNVKYIKKMEESHANISDSLYFTFFPKNITKIMKPKTDKGYAITKAAVDLALSRNSMLNVPVSGQQLKAFNAMVNYRNAIKKNTQADNSVTLFDIEALKTRDENGLERPIGIYDYGFLNLDENRNQTGKSGLIGIFENSRMNREILKISEKIKNGQELSADEKVSFDFLSRLGQSFKEGGINTEVQGKWYTNALTEKSASQYQTLDNLEYARRKLRELGDQQGTHNGLHIGYKHMIDDFFSLVSENTIMAGHNIKGFDLPYIKHILNNVAGAREYVKGNYEDKMKYVFGENALIYDSLEALKILPGETRHQLLSILSRGKKTSGTLGQSETIHGLMAPEEEIVDVHHFGLGDSKSQGQMMGIIPFSNGEYNHFLYDEIDVENIDRAKKMVLGDYNGGDIYVQPFKNHNPYGNLGYVFDGSETLYFSNKIQAVDGKNGSYLANEQEFTPSVYQAGKIYRISNIGIVSPQSDPRLKELGRNYWEYGDDDFVAVTMEQVTGKSDKKYLRGKKSSTVLVPQSQFMEWFPKEMGIVQVGDKPTELGKPILRYQYGKISGGFASAADGAVRERVLENAKRAIERGKTNSILKAIDFINIAENAEVQLGEIAEAIHDIALNHDYTKFKSIVGGEAFTKNLESYKFYGFENKNFYNFFINDKFNPGWFDNTMALAETMHKGSIPAKLAIALKESMKDKDYTKDEKEAVFTKAMDMALMDYHKGSAKAKRTVKAKENEIILNIPNFMRSTRINKMIREENSQFVFKLDNPFAVLNSLRKTVSNINRVSEGLPSNDHAIIYKFIHSIIDEEEIFSPENASEEIDFIKENLERIALDIDIPAELKIAAIQEEFLNLRKMDPSIMSEKTIEENLLETPFFKNAAPESFDPAKYLEAAEEHVSNNILDSKTANTFIKDYITGGNAQREAFQDSVKILGEKRKNIGTAIFDLHQKALAVYSRTLMDAIKENGGAFQIDKDAGTIKIVFSDDPKSAIDASTLLPRYETRNGYAAIKIGRTSYIPRTFATIDKDGNLIAKSEIEEVLRLNGINSDTLAEKIKMGKAIDKPVAEVIRSVMSSVSKGLRETERDEGFALKAAENFRIIDIGKLLRTKHGRSQLQEYFNKNIDKYGIDNDDVKLIQKFIRKNMSEDEDVWVPSHIDNALKALLGEGFMPTDVQIGDETSKLHVAVKGAKMQQGYMGLDDIVVGSNAFTSLPRGIEHVEKSTVVLNKAAIEERASKIIGVDVSDEFGNVYNAVNNRGKYTRSVTVNDKMTEVSLAGNKFDPSLGITTREMNTFTRDKIFMGDNEVNALFEQQYGKRTLDKLKTMANLRIQPTESGGFITGRYIRSAGYIYGERHIDINYRTPYNNTPEGVKKLKKSIRIDFDFDENGRIIPKYKKGYLVKEGENIIHSYSSFGDTEESFKARRASRVNMQYIAKGTDATVTERQVSDIVYAEAAREGKTNLTTTEFQKYADRLFDKKVVARPIEYNPIYKVIQGSNKEKSMVQHGLTSLREFLSGDFLRILDRVEFKEASKNAGIDITTALLDEDLFNDIAEGKFESILFKGINMSKVKDEIIKAGNKTNPDNGLLAWETALKSNRDLFDRYVVAHTHADFISQSSADAMKHKSGFGAEIEQTYTRIKNKLVSQGVPLAEAENIALNAVNKNITTALSLDEEGNLLFPDTRDIGVNIEGLEKTAEEFNLEKSPLSHTTIKLISDSVNLDKKVMMGKREYASLSNRVLSSELLSEIFEGITDEKEKALFMEDFRGYTKDGKFSVDSKDSLLWQRPIEQIIEDNIFYGDGKGTIINSENDLESEELKKSYRKLRAYYSDNVPLTKELVSDMVLLQNHDEARKLNKFGATSSDEFIGVSAAEANIAPISNNARYYTDVEKTVWHQNTRIDLQDDSLGLTEEFFKKNEINSSIYIPKDDPAINGNELALKDYQKNSRAVVNNYRTLKKFMENKEALSANPRKAEVLRNTLVKSIKEYTKSQKEYSTSTKSGKGLRYDIANKRFELSGREKTQVYQISSIKSGDADLIFEKLKYRGKSLAERFKNNELVNFQISSIEDLDKFGFTDEYFERRGIIKAEWIKKAKTEGVKALFNRAPSDYPNSTVAVQLYFSDAINKGTTITDEITAFMTHNDADGDSTAASIVRSFDQRNNGLLTDELSARMLGHNSSTIAYAHNKAIQLQMRHYNDKYYRLIHPDEKSEEKIIDDVYHEEYQKKKADVLMKDGTGGYYYGSRATFLTASERKDALNQYHKSIEIVRNSLSGKEKEEFDNTKFFEKREKINQYIDKLQENDRLVVRDGLKAINDVISAESASMLKSGQNIVAEIDSGLDILDALRNMYQADDNMYHLDQETITGMTYIKESAKEGFLSPKHGDYNIMDPQYRGVAKTMKDTLDTILSGKGDVNDAFKTLENIMVNIGRDVTGRYGPESHIDMIKTGLKGIRQVMSSISAEHRGNIYAMQNYIREATQNVIDPMSKINEIQNILNDNLWNIESIFTNNIPDSQAANAISIKEAMEASRMVEERMAKSKASNFARIGEKVFAPTRIPSSGGLGRGVMMLAAAIIGAGYVGGNPSAPAGTEARTRSDQENQNYSVERMPKITNSNLSAMRQGPKQGYIININARSEQETEQISRIISEAVNNNFQNTQTNISLTVNNDPTSMSMSDMYDYMSNSL